jgi:hypothetical protein
VTWGGVEKAVGVERVVGVEKVVVGVSGLAFRVTERWVSNRWRWG